MVTSDNFKISDGSMIFFLRVPKTTENYQKIKGYESVYYDPTAGVDTKKPEPSNVIYNTTAYVYWVRHRGMHGQ